MRDFVQHSLFFAVVGLAAPATQVLAQSAEEPEEIIVRAKPLKRYRAEIELARDEMIRVFNEANEGEDNDVRCRYDVPTGSHIPQRVCFSVSQDRASANVARDLLNGLLVGDVVAGVSGLQNAPSGESRAMVEFEKEWRRVMSTNLQFQAAVVEYRELENEFDRARGETIRIPIPSFTLKGPQCEASTYTEYEQRGNVARVTGTVSVSACPAGTTGKFALVARVKDDAGVSKPIEFMEMWQSDDPKDYTFFADYPIGDNVFLESVRVRNLTCTCEPAQ